MCTNQLRYSYAVSYSVIPELSNKSLARCIIAIILADLWSIIVVRDMGII